MSNYFNYIYAKLASFVKSHKVLKALCLPFYNIIIRLLPRHIQPQSDKNILLEDFNAKEYYNTYPERIILRPGYPARAQYKSTMFWRLYGNQILKELGQIKTYADIGGCFGFGANSMAFRINQKQGYYPDTKVFEISSNFVSIGKVLFPYINLKSRSIIPMPGTLRRESHRDLLAFG